jgi:hypothetical protein
MYYLDHLAQKIGYSSYEEYLSGEHWKEFSKQVRTKSCYCCRARCTRLSVHHITYDRLGSELPADVITVCDECHEKIHEIARKGEPLRNAHNVLMGKQERKSPPIKPEKARKVQITTEQPQQIWFTIHLLGVGKRSVRIIRKVLKRKGLMDKKKRPNPRAFAEGYAKILLNRKGHPVVWNRSKIRTLIW